uniref:Uncharacterized protein n=1 Tax=Homalodisca liturata TaxID=320908 RepID=A0A1B6IQV4_9HEMI
MERCGAYALLRPRHDRHTTTAVHSGRTDPLVVVTRLPSTVGQRSLPVCDQDNMERCGAYALLRPRHDRHTTTAVHSGRTDPLVVVTRLPSTVGQRSLPVCDQNNMERCGAMRTTRTKT